MIVTTELKLPPVQTRMMDLLSDGNVHSGKDLCACIDQMATVKGNLYAHIKILRRHLRTTSLDVVVYSGEGYRLVRLLSKDE